MEVIVVNERFNGSLENQVKQALTSLKRDIQEKGYNIKSIIKLNVFIKTDGEVEFFEIKEEIETLISKLFPENIPAYTIISQPPLAGNSILLEGYVLEKKAGLKIERYKLSKHHYVVVSYSKGKRREIYSGGITIDKSRDFISDCQNAFDFAEQLLMKEDMNFGNIVRQWNYIPSILSVNKFENGSLQNYQIFNDIRALYFDP